MDRIQTVSHAKANKYQVFLTDGGTEYPDDEFYVLAVDSFTAYGKNSNEVIATNLHYKEVDNREEYQKGRMLDMQDDCKHFGIDCDKVNWNPVRL